MHGSYRKRRLIPTSPYVYQVLLTGFLLTSEVFPRLFILFYDHVYYSFSFVYFVLCSCVFTFVLYRFRTQCIYEGWYSGMETLRWTNPGYIITILSSHHLAYAYTWLIYAYIYSSQVIHNSKGHTLVLLSLSISLLSSVFCCITSL